MISFLWSLLVDIFKKPKPVHYHRQQDEVEK